MSEPARVSFAVAPCTLHTHTSGERPASSELHHVFPLYLQKRVGAKDPERVPVCGSGHSDVHLAIDAILAGKKMPRGVGISERALAKEAIRRFTKANKGGST